MRHFLDFVIRKLVDHPEDVDIYEVDDPKAVTFRLSLHPDDVGKVIGKNGRTIGAIRNLLNAAAAKSNTRIVVEIIENAA